MFLSPMIAAPPVRLEVIYSESANLAYGLDAISGSLSSVDPAVQRPLWDARFLRADDDRKAVVRWGAIKAKYARSLPLPGLTMPLLARNDALSIGNAIEAVELGTRSVEEMADRLSDFIPLADVEELRAIMGRFRVPYHRWWKEVAQRRGGSFARGMRERFADSALQREVASFARFYGVTLPKEATGRFSLIFRGDAEGPTQGQQLQGIAAVEFRPDERSEDRLGTLIHEFCHFLYGSRPPEADAALQARFVVSGDQIAKPALNLINETLATTLGNGIVGRRYASAEGWARRMRTPRSLYNDDAIDRASKRLLPILDATIAAGGSMDDPGFATAYLKAMEAEFGEALLRPSGMLKEAFVLTDARFGKGFSRQVVRTLHIAGAYREEAERIDAATLTDFAAQPHLSAVFTVSPERLDELVARGVLDAEDAATIRGVLGEAKSAVLGRARTRFAVSYVIVAQDADAALLAARRLEARTTPLVGILP